MKKGIFNKKNIVLLVGVLLGICVTVFLGNGQMSRRGIEVRKYIANRDRMIGYGLELSAELSQIYSSKLSEEQILAAKDKIEQCILQQGWNGLDARSVVNEVYEYIYALKYDDNEHRKTAYETIFYETGDCMGKADLFCKFMDSLGIEAFIIPIYPDGSKEVLRILPEETWEDYSQKGHAINGVIIENECYLIDCCNGEFMFQGIYGEDNYVKRRLIALHEFDLSYQSNIELIAGNDSYHFKYEIMPQIVDEIIRLLQKK